MQVKSATCFVPEPKNWYFRMEVSELFDFYVNKFISKLSFRCITQFANAGCRMSPKIRNNLHFSVFWGYFLSTSYQIPDRDFSCQMRFKLLSNLLDNCTQ